MKVIKKNGSIIWGKTSIPEGDSREGFHRGTLQTFIARSSRILPFEDGLPWRVSSDGHVMFSRSFSTSRQFGPWQEMLQW